MVYVPLYHIFEEKRLYWIYLIVTGLTFAMTSVPARSAYNYADLQFTTAGQSEPANIWHTEPRSYAMQLHAIQTTNDIHC